MTPRDRRSQRPLALGSVARPSGEQRETLGETLGQRVGTEQRHPARRQLQRERKTVERGHDADHGGRRPFVESKPGMHGGGPLREQSNGIERLRIRGIVRGPAWAAARIVARPRSWSGMRLVARTVRPGEPSISIPNDRCGLDHLLHVVQHQQQLAVPEMSPQRIRRVLSRVAPDLERRGDLGQHHLRVGHRAEVDEERPVGESIQDLRRHADRQPGLAGATRADDRHQARAAEHLLEPRHLLLAAHERGPFGGQVGGTCVERPELREVGRQPGDHEIVEPQRIGEVLETVKPQIAQDHTVRQGLFDETRGRVREDHLAAMADRGDAGRAIHVDPEVVVTAERALTGVHADADADLRSVGPGVRRKPSLGLRRREHRAGRRAEDREERVALGPDLDPAPPVDGLAHDHAVRVLQLSVGFGTERLEQPGRALDIREQERHDPRGQIGWCHRCLDSVVRWRPMVSTSVGRPLGVRENASAFEPV